MLRDQDRSNTFTPGNAPEKNEWVFANIQEMATHCGSEPVLVDEIFSELSHMVIYQSGEANGPF